MAVGRQAGAPYGYDVEEFINAYMSCNDNIETAALLGITRKMAADRANHLRVAGFMLPYRQEKKNTGIEEELSELDVAMRGLHG